MDSGTLPDDPPNPLEHILQAERDNERQIRLAEEAAAALIAQARQQAVAIKAEGVERGRRQGRAEHDAILEAARQEAGRIVDQAREQAGALAADARSHLPAMVDRILAAVLGKGRLDG